MAFVDVSKKFHANKKYVGLGDDQWRSEFVNWLNHQYNSNNRSDSSLGRLLTVRGGNAKTAADLESFMKDDDVRKNYREIFAGSRDAPSYEKIMKKKDFN
jgi:hypothetical protein